MAAYNDRLLPGSPHLYHLDYIWRVDHNQGLGLRFPFGGPVLNGLEVAPTSDKEIAIEHEKELAASTEDPRSPTATARLRYAWSHALRVIGTDRRGPYLGLTRRFLLILLVMLLVIAGIVVLVVQLVSGSKDSSPQLEMTPLTDLGRHYALSNGGVDPSTNLTLTVDLIPTLARTTHLRLKEQSGTFYYYFFFQKVNDTGGAGRAIRFRRRIGRRRPEKEATTIAQIED